MLNPHVFRAYDVRGLVGPDINPDVFRQVGRAYATLVRRNSGRRIAVGQDNRLSSNGLKAGFVDGVRAAGVEVIDIGLVTTPILYFATAHWKLEGGANITGSHNPIEYNGVKMVHPGAVPLSEEEIQALRTMAERGDYESGAGELTQRSPQDDYCESDGSFPNHLPDPEDEHNVEDLKAKVVEVGADLGVAYDGDADRVGVIDERGHRHEADLILILLARDLLSRHPGAKIVFDVKSSQALVDDIRKHGGVPVMWKT